MLGVKGLKRRIVQNIAIKPCKPAKQTQIKTVIYPCFYLLISQLGPVNPSEQLHIGPNEVFMHVPLLEHFIVEQFSDDALCKYINMLIKEKAM